MLSQQTARTDEEIIASYPLASQDRVRVELQIVNAIIERAGQLGYTLRVFDDVGEEYDLPGYDVKTAVFDLDVCSLDVEDANGDRVGFVALNFGSEDGCDLVSDYGPVGTEDDQPMTAMEAFIIPICKLSDSLG